MGKTLNELKKTLENITSKTTVGNTKGEVLGNFNLLYVDVLTTVSIKDAEGAAVDSPTVVIKKGETIGSGDTVTAESGGGYKVKVGKYNYSVSKTGYDTATGVIDVVLADAKAGNKAINVVLSLTEA